MKGKWIVACLAVVLCLLPIMMSEPISEQEADLKQVESIKMRYDNHVLDLAEKGMLEGQPFHLSGLSIEDVINEWGEPSESLFEDGSFYASYPRRHIVIGYNRAGVFELRSEHPELQQLSGALILSELGPPAEIRQTKRHRQYIYRAGEYEWTILIDQEDDHILHQAVYNSIQKDRGEYLLEIKGDSSSLMESARIQMDKWRKEIRPFIEKHPFSISANGENLKQVALTFDDGPDERVTEEIIDILREYDVPGNFFFLGSQAALYPRIVQKAYLDGHLIASHSDEHLDLTTLTEEQMQVQIDRSSRQIESIIGKYPNFFRPPYGEINAKLLNILSNQGKHTVLWSIDTLDWSVHTAAEVSENVKRYVRNGDIILMHSNAEQAKTAQALREILDYLINRDFEIVKLDEMLNREAYEN